MLEKHGNQQHQSPEKRPAWVNARRKALFALLGGALAFANPNEAQADDIPIPVFQAPPPPPRAGGSPQAPAKPSPEDDKKAESPKAGGQQPKKGSGSPKRTPRVSNEQLEEMEEALAEQTEKTEALEKALKDLAEINDRLAKKEMELGKQEAELKAISNVTDENLWKQKEMILMYIFGLLGLGGYFFNRKRQNERDNMQEELQKALAAGMGTIGKKLRDEGILTEDEWPDS